MKLNVVCKTVQDLFARYSMSPAKVILLINVGFTNEFISHIV